MHAYAGLNCTQKRFLKPKYAAKSFLAGTLLRELTTLPQTLNRLKAVITIAI